MNIQQEFISIIEALTGSKGISKKKICAKTGMDYDRLNYIMRGNMPDIYELNTLKDAYSDVLDNTSEREAELLKRVELLEKQVQELMKRLNSEAN